MINTLSKSMAVRLGKMLVPYQSKMDILCYSRATVEDPWSYREMTAVGNSLALYLTASNAQLHSYLEST